MVLLSGFPQLSPEGPHFIGSVHINLFAEKCPYGVNDHEPRLVLLNRLCDSLIREGQRFIAVVDDQDPIKVGTNLQQSGRDGVCQTVLYRLVDYV